MSASDAASTQRDPPRSNARVPSAEARLKRELSAFAAALPRIADLPPDEFDRWFYDVLDPLDSLCRSLPLDRRALMEHFSALSAAEFSLGLIQERARRKPLGYAGDYLTIDWMYTRAHAEDGRGRLWDEFYHRQQAAIAVRNRKAYFGEVLRERVQESGRPLRILNLACGGCRDVADALRELGMPAEGLRFDCVDLEARALEHARTLTAPFGELADFRWYHEHVLRFAAPVRYDLAWSAGLFDYLNDRRAATLLRRTWNALEDGGRMVIGNFHPSNSTRSYMEWCMEWVLIHRVEEDFRRLCFDAGIPETAVSFQADGTGAVLFCIVQR